MARTRTEQMVARLKDLQVSTLDVKAPDLVESR
jgi:hypothetical protein